MQESVTIKLLGQEYKIKAGGDADHVQLLSRYIDDKVREAQQQGKAATTMELVAVLLLNMADDVYRTRQELDEMQETVSRQVDRLIDRLDIQNKTCP